MSIELILALYASVISTLMLFWRMFAYFNDRKTRLKVSHRMMTRVVAYDWGVDTNSQSRYLEIAVTNRGTATRYIERPLFRINKKVNGADTFTPFTQEEMAISYPRPIQPGQRIECAVPLEGIQEKLNEAKGATKVKSIIVDTHGKKFETKWLAVS